MYENYKYGNFDKLESAIDDALNDVLNQARKQRKEAFWSNREPKQRMTKQERDTVDALTSFITTVNGVPSKKPVSTKTKSRRRLESGGVTARV
ncbi:hypothetical protein HGO23_04040 [Xenorhabdus budapestensis]|uniref:Uncharacterized protein n=1 Tax=Xenorhabdus budapestensis TaxID=290110 RepID=A0ABX7VIJ3_XENBU|nr:hypothetical protein [Xenorhabdus budapestensis]QTL40569.1 hypothetical protein HGO23_04040 [Xenorhabdus budapestensis]